MPCSAWTATLAPLPALLAAVERSMPFCSSTTPTALACYGPQDAAAGDSASTPHSILVSSSRHARQAAGVSGRFVAGDDEVIEWLLRARAPIFSPPRPTWTAAATT